MTEANVVLMHPSKGRFFLFNKEQHGVMGKKITQKKEGSLGGLP